MPITKNVQKISTSPKKKTIASKPKAVNKAVHKPKSSPVKQVKPKQPLTKASSSPKASSPKAKKSIVKKKKLQGGARQGILCYTNDAKTSRECRESCDDRYSTSIPCTLPY